MVSHDLPRSTVTNQTTFDQRISNSIPDFERAMDRRYLALVLCDEIFAKSIHLTLKQREKLLNSNVK